MFMLSFIDPAIVLFMFMLSFIDPAIVLSMFMLSFIDPAIDVAGLNRFIVSQPSPLDNWISNGNTYTNDKKNLHRFASTQKDHILPQR
jgi:hypothetical protein